jgi:hypothetical protein
MKIYLKQSLTNVVKERIPIRIFTMQLPNKSKIITIFEHHYIKQYPTNQIKIIMVLC